jgi:hypothetical protein
MMTSFFRPGIGVIVANHEMAQFILTGVVRYAGSLLSTAPLGW